MYGRVKVRISKAAPTLDELTAMLRQKFSGRYSCEQFGLYGEKNIFVSKSNWVAVQISTSGNAIELIPTSKPAVSTFISLLIAVCTLSGFWELFFIFDRKKLVLEVGLFLKEKYN